MATERDPLDALFDSVAGGEPVDWDRAEAGVRDGGHRSQVRALRDVSRLASFHRGLQREVAPGGDAREIERWGDLLLLERVGNGTGGDVHRAWDPTLQREVALKRLHPRAGASRADLLEEARALARVRHPHVVAVHGAGEHDGRVGLWMEFLDGPTLEQEIARRGPLPPGQVARQGAQLAHALAAVHGAGALHRDVKPANVMLAREDRAVLMDFGLGQRRGAGRDDPGPFSGTPMFMSPQRLGGASATVADDVYALGATLRCALIGAPPFEARTLEELRLAAAAGPARRLRDLRREIPEPLAAAVERAMDPRAEARFGTAAEMAAALERATPSASASAARSGTGIAWAAVALAAALALIGWWRSASRAPAPAPVLPAPGPAPARLAGAYDISATFLKRAAGGDRTLAVDDEVAPGDRLSLRLRATRPVWVYVLDSDDRGETYLLFPQPIFDLANPMPQDSTVVLPGPRGGRENAWTVTSRGGREHLLVVASPQRVPELEAELAQVPAPTPGAPVRYARVGSGTVERLRGIGGVSEVAPAPGPGRPAALFERIQALAGSEQGVHGVWVRQVTLENPLR